MRKAPRGRMWDRLKYGSQAMRYNWYRDVYSLSYAESWPVIGSQG